MDAHSPQSNQDYSVCSRESKRTLYSALAEHGSVDAHDQTHVVNFLASASNYGLPGPVECIETANYYLFLSGPYCFKLFRQCPKDAASGEPPRRHSLEERYQLALREIEFGQLYSPKLYLGLVPVWQRDAALFMQVPQTANGEQPSLKHVALQQDVIADWVIVLHRYDASNSFDRFVEHYQPNYIECQKLAHLFEPKSGEEVIDQQGESWLTFLYKSLEDLEPFVRSCDSKTKKNTLRACLNRAKGQLDRSKPAILHREDHGLFRHIHGDVKLSNVVDLRDNFCLINPRVEDEHGAMTELIGDPFYDIAALVGELWSRNLNKQANWVFPIIAADSLTAMPSTVC
ncbi:hypothetical protein [uncultured Cohaesibacter sp.]|uniref:hypothetical protein n=1 Tax=uncultured Cohaesibacter sp. TaxID=1002546 RepID=UPI00292D7B67|nr:hypothetical protein [uncultured Cohaesibacter sp.]